MPADLDRARDLFVHAVGQVPPERWEEHTADACGPDTDLRDAVCRLLRAHREAGSFLERPVYLGPTLCLPPDTATDVAGAAGQAAGEAVGPYRLLELIGEGGMGTVWLAEQSSPVRRRVALKVIRAGMDSQQILARFEAERQVLALMDHPNIARFLDAGATDAGLPFFVMELVKGVPINQYCDEHRLTVRERLGLFRSVCEAVHHAHQKGVIHRDIKPSNVMVAGDDGGPEVKVIDFGLAKAAGKALTERTLFTGFGALVGTPEYMSPEQAALNNQDIDTRSDIYSLGVLLYELLTGTTPSVCRRGKDMSLVEVLRRVREEEPPRPSDRLSSADGRADAAPLRGCNPAELARLLRGELDWITLKALEKERGRRYESAAALAADVGRYLNDEPVQACPPSAWYRLGKFARGNRTAVAVAALALVAVLAGAAAGGWWLRDKADLRGRTAEHARAALAESRAHQLHRRFFEALEAGRKAEAALASGEPGPGLREEVRARLLELRLLVRLEDVRRQKGLAREVMVGTTVDVEGWSWGEKEREAGKWRPLTGVPVGDEVDRAFAEHDIPLDGENAEEIAQRIAATGVAVELASALDDLAMWRRGSRQPASRWRHLLEIARLADPDPWRARLRAALERDSPNALEALAGEDDALRLPLPSQLNLAESLHHARKWGPMVRFLRRAQRLHPGEYWLNIHLAQALRRVGRPEDQAEIVRCYAAALATRPRDPLAQIGLGNALKDAGDLDGAIAAFERAAELDEATFLAHVNLADALDDKGLPDRALAVIDRAIHLRPDSATAHSNRGVILVRLKRYPEAVATFEQALRLDPKHSSALLNLGSALRQNEEHARAAAVLRQACSLHPRDFSPRISLAKALEEAGNAREALPAFRDAYRRRLPNARLLLDLGATLLKRDLLDEAATAFHESLMLDPTNADAHAALGDAHRERGRLDEAIPAYREAIRLRPGYAQAHNNLAVVLAHRGRVAEAIKHHEEAVRFRPTSADFRLRLAATLCDFRGDYDGAITVVEEAMKLKRDDPLAYDYLGCALSGKRDHRGAVAAFRELARLTPGNLEVWVKLGNAHAALKQHAECSAAFREALRRKPDYFEAHLALARALGSLGHRPESIRAYLAAVRVRPNDVTCLAEMAEVMDAAGRAADAEWAWRRAIDLMRGMVAGPSPRPEVRSRLGGTLNNLAMLLLRQKKPAEAARLLEEAIPHQDEAFKAQPGTPRFRQFLSNHHLNLADARLVLGGHAEAARAIANLPRLYPNSWFAHFRNVEVLSRCIELAGGDDSAVRKYTQAARRHIREAVRCCGSDASSLDSTAWCLANSLYVRSPALAVELARQAVDLAPSKGEYWGTLGVAHFRVGAWKEAVKALEQARRRRYREDGADLLFLAMAHWQAGNKEAAHRWHGRAEEWMQKAGRVTDEHRFFQKEAAALLEAGKKEK